ncbi:zinc-ribbon domain-containing protein [Endozoicomonas ascidiicola]|uniref:zinc-ribbon domain-containing protein n=1 Tax=Endozoicomonas ascidiicola TaxID=1698521 RepID=UPI00082CE603|nr:zinc-ribbon domain-containing protein [Endozoicomonas ascidiicola]
MPNKKCIKDDKAFLKIFDKTNNPKHLLLESIKSKNTINCRCINKGCRQQFTRTAAQIYESLRNCPEAKGCLRCAKKIAGEKRRIQTIAKRGSLKLKNKNLAREWDNGRKNCIAKGEHQRRSKDVSAGGGREVGYFLCDECNHLWKTSLRSRLNKGCGCPNCAIEKRKNTPIKRKIGSQKTLTRARTVIKKDKKLRREYFSENNGSLEKLNVSMTKKIYWKCPVSQHKPYLAPTKDKKTTPTRQGSRCPSCAANSLSPIQAALTCFIIELFSDFTIKVRQKPCGHEADIEIEELKCIIEIDGSHWHDEDKKIKKDRLKSKVWNKKGYIVIRLRDKRLTAKAFWKDHTCFDIVEIDNLATCIKTLAKTLLNTLPLKNRHVIKQLNRIISKGITDDERLRFYYMQPQPLPGNSLKDKYPNLCRFWAKSNPMRPENFYPSSSLKVNWICPICQQEYSQTIGQRTHIDCRTGLPRFTHRQCCQKIRHADNVNKIHEWMLNPRGRSVLPERLMRGVKN